MELTYSMCPIRSIGTKDKFKCDTACSWYDTKNSVCAILSIARK